MICLISTIGGPWWLIICGVLHVLIVLSSEALVVEMYPMLDCTLVLVSGSEEFEGS